ncbi:NUDIX hydrolase [Niveibacterium sp. SC-1]|uniref:NUDIX hydrolase n=1 Tax=Niveibacterium sp. SC-1 TaxID=3135646 RepID=UPI00311D8D31
MGADRAWNPHVTVAAVVERDGRFLLVEEETTEGLRFNQPAGHLEEGESLVAACVRETLEETAHEFTPTALVGVYHWRKPGSDLTYVRFAFAGEIGREHPGRTLDEGILRASWLDEAELAAARGRFRSPLVQACIDDYRAGKRYPLELIRHFEER